MSTQIVQLESKVSSVPHEASRLAIADQQSYDNASRFLLDVVIPLRREVEETFGPIKKKAHEAHAEAVAQEKRHLAPLQEAERIIKGKIADWMAEQERLRRQEQLRLEEAARKAEEEERLQAAIEAEEAGEPEQAAAILEVPAPVPMPVAAPTYQKAAGISAPKDNWSALCVNLHLLVQHVAANPQDLGLILPNQTALNQRARAAKNLLKLPGVNAVNSPNIAVRGR